MRRNESASSNEALINPASSANVLFVDRSSLFAEGVARLLTDHGYSILGRAGSVKELAGFATVLSACGKAILIIGPFLHTCHGFAACRWARNQAATVRVVFISEDFADPILQADAARLGVGACLPVETSLNDLLSVLAVVWMGHSLLRPPPDVNRLTECKLRVLQKIAEKKTSKQIAAELSIAENTVRNEAQTILEKLHVHSRREAVHRARHLGGRRCNPRTRDAYGWRRVPNELYRR